MSSFDPTTARKAVAEFTPRRPQRFQDLHPAKDVIAELRQKRASYRAIAELLTKCCLLTSKTAIAGFCHEVLGETVRPHRRNARRRLPVAVQNNDEPSAALVQSAPESPADANNEESQPARRGPRIAQVRILKPQPS